MFASTRVRTAVRTSSPSRTCTLALLLALVGVGSAEGAVSYSVSGAGSKKQVTITDSETGRRNNAVEVSCVAPDPRTPPELTILVNGGEPAQFIKLPDCRDLVGLSASLGGNDDSLDLRPVRREDVDAGLAAAGIDVALGSGKNTLFGSGLDERAVGGADDDTISLGAGDDVYQAATGGSDVVDAGFGQDTLVVRAPTRGIDAGPVDLRLSDRGFDAPNERSAITSFEQAALETADADDTLDARDFSGPVSMKSAGGRDVAHASLAGGTIDLGSSPSTLGGRGDELHLRGADVTVTAAAVAGDHPRVIAGVDHLFWKGGTGGDRFDASGFPALVTADGAGGDDRLTGGPGATSLAGGDGRDAITAGTGPATLDGGASDDVLTGGAGLVKITGGAGEDVVVAGTGGGAVSGGDGADRVVLGPGPDDADGGEGGDTVQAVRGGPVLLDATSLGGEPVRGFERAEVTGGDGPDQLDATAFPGTTLLTGLAGPDALLGGAAADTLDGGAGDDSLEGRDGPDTLLGGDGNDALSGGPGEDTLDGGAGDDALNGGEGNDRLGGGEGNDRFEIGPGNDAFDGGPGTDLIDHLGTAAVTIDLGGGASGVAGQVAVYTNIERAFGGPGKDTLRGSSGNDELHGRAGNDIVDGGAGNDTQFGEGGADLLRPGPGGPGDADVLLGGDGVDVVSYAGRGAPLTIDLDGVADDGQAGEQDQVDPSNEAVVGGNGNDTITLAPKPSGKPTLRLVQGGRGNDRLTGGVGADVLGGGAGNDTLVGGAGNDSLQGGAGDDSLDAGDGNDRAYPQRGVDEVELGAGDDVAFSLDLGTDEVSCEAGEDVVYYGPGDEVVDGCEAGTGRASTEKPSVPGGHEDGTDDTIADSDGLLGPDGAGESDVDGDGETWATGDAEDELDLALDGELEFGFEGLDDGFGSDFGDDFDEDFFGDGFDDFDDAFAEDQGLDGTRSPATKVTTRTIRPAKGRYPVRISCPRKVTKRCIGEVTITAVGKSAELATATFAVNRGKSVITRPKLTKAGRRTFAKRKKPTRLDVTVDGRDRGIGLWHVVKTVKLGR